MIISKQSGLQRGILLAGILMVLAFSGAFSLATGGRSDVGWEALFFGGERASAIISDIRLPRTIAAVLLGVNLAIAGLILQTMTRNALASPAILGINQGAALGLALALILPDIFLVGPDVMAFIGAFSAGVITFAIAGGFLGRMDSTRLILGGVAVGAFSYAMVRFSYTLEDDIARSIVRWTVGDITDIRWPAVKDLAIWSIIGGVAASLITKRLNLMALGDAAANGLGADPRFTLFVGALIAAALTSASVSVAGPIAFIGLVVPHLARLLFGGDVRMLLPLSALLGASLMLLSDGLSKVLTAPVEAPIGVISALIGAPWFLWLTVFSKDVK